MKKNVHYSFWVIFDNKQQRQLENLKKRINNVLKGPYFPIHMSLCGELLEDEKELINKIKKNLSKLDKFSIEIDKYGYKNTYFQSLYTKVIKNTKLVSQKKTISNLPTLKKVIKIANFCLSCREEKKLKWEKEKKIKLRLIKTF